MLLEVMARSEQHALFHTARPVFEERTGPLHFIVDHDGKLYLDYYPHGQAITVSARTIDEYERRGCIPRNALDMLADSHAQVVDVGSGLSEFVVALAYRTHTKPIIIDPLPYGEVDTLFARAYPHAPIRSQNVITELRKRIETIMDPTKITLYNDTFGQTIARHADTLMESADVVIDCKGPNFWLRDDHTILTMEKLLLKPQRATKVWTEDTFF